MGVDCERGQCCWTFFGPGCRGVEAQIERECKQIVQGALLLFLYRLQLIQRFNFLYQLRLIQKFIFCISLD